MLKTQTIYRKEANLFFNMLLASCVIAYMGCNQHQETKIESRILIAYSGELQGYLEECG
jgi:hypothetical protein